MKSTNNNKSTNHIKSANNKNNNKNNNADINTDNNTQLYNRSQEKFDNYYTGNAGDTVVISPPPYATSPYPPPQKNDISGIPSSQIPQGQEDLYILKSQVIPPVCPACPTMSGCPNNKPPPPCPPCARCPEPAFECKKVPNYNSSDSRYLPLPVLADFSQFGM